MKKNYSKADAATVQPTAIETNMLKIIQPDMTPNGIEIKTSGIITFLNKSIYVQDLCEYQNAALFEKGIKLIANKVTPTRSNYIFHLLQLLLPNSSEAQPTIMKISKNLCPLMSFVCDIACHDNKKLANEQAYDKDFKKYVSNLFYQYHLNEAFERTLKLGGDYISIPEFLVHPEKYHWV